jgi:hypothetical protein
LMRHQVTASALCLTPTAISVWSSVMDGCASYSSVDRTGESSVTEETAGGRVRLSSHCHADHHRRYRQRLLLVGYTDEPTSITNSHRGNVVSFVRRCCDSFPRTPPPPPRRCDSFPCAHPPAQSPSRTAVEDCSRTAADLPSPDQLREVLRAGRVLPQLRSWCRRCRRQRREDQV